MYIFIDIYIYTYIYIDIDIDTYIYIYIYTPHKKEYRNTYRFEFLLASTLECQLPSNTFILLMKIGVQSAQELPAQARLEQLLLPPLHTRLPLAQCQPRSRAQRGLRCTPRRPQRAAAPAPWPLCDVTHSYVGHDAFIHVT